ncbi:hypothetical protein D9758_015263 [Tetrapyrgos nigripes]|uniref:Reverse transcriptase domain-containing protein n=1 Tax=Tetrapyrgos nigripes TaxID=182062 RepID=A0A8H5C346_9AGAR|nr:hypothetical protein D9758_015263 [Tetrapyrgos nigripes]
MLLVRWLCQVGIPAFPASDDSLSIFQHLVNYILHNSHAPSCTKPSTLSIFHKRGSRTLLRNCRGVTFSNYILNHIGAWENFHLVPYCAKHNIIPPTQIASQPGVQGRDLLSFLAHLQTWAVRNKQSLYVLQRDQQKGFDMLEPEGFYDALRAYGLPQSLIDLDISFQSNVPYSILSAYGLTDPFIVNGVTKQGGPLSPLKSCLMTSLGHYWLNDLLRNDPGALVISTANCRNRCFHTPIDNVTFLVHMVEAMDDSLLLATRLSTTRHACLAMERLQSCYGAKTCWPKSCMYFLNVIGPIPQTITMPTVSPENPFDECLVPLATVPVSSDCIHFLRTDVDRPKAQYFFLRDLIIDFQLPLLSKQLPLTAIRCILSQCLISKIRPRLSYQPISHADAVHLDVLIASKVHHYFGYPFHPSSTLLSLPVSHFGFDFPSIAELNLDSAVRGLLRDLNHHVPVFRQMARITLADWSCSLNCCLHPFVYDSLHRSFLPFTFSSHRKLPFVWVLAHDHLQKLDISLHSMDQSHVFLGDVSLQHCVNVLRHSRSFSSVHALPNFRQISELCNFNLDKLSDFSSWTSFPSPHLQLSLPSSRRFPSNFLFMTWYPLLLVLHNLSLLSLVHGDSSLALPRDIHQTTAESSFLQMVTVPSFLSRRHCDFPSSTVAADASLIPPSPNVLQHRSITFAALHDSHSYVASVQTSRLFSNILHGELYALILATLLYKKHPTSPNLTLLSDHLNAVRFLSNALSHSPSATVWAALPASSLYRWLYSLLISLPNSPTISHVRAHTSQLDIPSQANALVDRHASLAQQLSTPSPYAPLPTFAMADYVLYHSSFGYIESGIPEVLKSLYRQVVVDPLSFSPAARMMRSLYDPHPPPSHPYLRASSAYSASIQLYLRSGQLPTRQITALRLHEKSSLCRFGCCTVESPHHLFVQCTHFNRIRAHYTARALESLQTHAQSMGIPRHWHENLHRVANVLFYDHSLWPLSSSRYYFGLLPEIQPHIPLVPSWSTLARERFITRLSNSWHYLAIQLAARIWGYVQRLRAYKYLTWFIHVYVKWFNEQAARQLGGPETLVIRAIYVDGTDADVDEGRVTSARGKQGLIFRLDPSHKHLKRGQENCAPQSLWPSDTSLGLDGSEEAYSNAPFKLRNVYVDGKHIILDFTCVVLMVDPLLHTSVQIYPLADWNADVYNVNKKLCGFKIVLAFEVWHFILCIASADSNVRVKWVDPKRFILSIWKEDNWSSLQSVIAGRRCWFDEANPPAYTPIFFDPMDQPVAFMEECAVWWMYEMRKVFNRKTYASRELWQWLKDEGRSSPFKGVGTYTDEEVIFYSGKLPWHRSTYVYSSPSSTLQTGIHPMTPMRDVLNCPSRFSRLVLAYIQFILPIHRCDFLYQSQKWHLLSRRNHRSAPGVHLLHVGSTRDAYPSDDAYECDEGADVLLGDCDDDALSDMSDLTDLSDDLYSGQAEPGGLPSGPQISIHRKQYNLDLSRFATGIVMQSASEKQIARYGSRHVRVHGQARTRTTARHAKYVKEYNSRINNDASSRETFDDPFEPCLIKDAMTIHEDLVNVVLRSDAVACGSDSNNALLMAFSLVHKYRRSWLNRKCYLPEFTPLFDDKGTDHLVTARPEHLGLDACHVRPYQEFVPDPASSTLSFAKPSTASAVDDFISPQLVDGKLGFEPAYLTPRLWLKLKKTHLNRLTEPSNGQSVITQFFGVTGNTVSDIPESEDEERGDSSLSTSQSQKAMKDKVADDFWSVVDFKVGGRNDLRSASETEKRKKLMSYVKKYTAGWTVGPYDFCAVVVVFDVNNRRRRLLAISRAGSSLHRLDYHTLNRRRDYKKENEQTKKAEKSRIRRLEKRKELAERLKYEKATQLAIRTGKPIPKFKKRPGPRPRIRKLHVFKASIGLPPQGRWGGQNKLSRSDRQALREATMWRAVEQREGVRHEEERGGTQSEYRDPPLAAFLSCASSRTHDQRSPVLLHESPPRMVSGPSSDFTRQFQVQGPSVYCVTSSDPSVSSCNLPGLTPAYLPPLPGSSYPNQEGQHHVPCSSYGHRNREVETGDDVASDAVDGPPARKRKAIRVRAGVENSRVNQFRRQKLTSKPLGTVFNNDRRSGDNVSGWHGSTGFIGYVHNTDTDRMDCTPMEFASVVDRHMDLNCLLSRSVYDLPSYSTDMTTPRRKKRSDQTDQDKRSPQKKTDSRKAKVNRTVVTSPKSRQTVLDAFIGKDAGSPETTEPRYRQLTIDRFTRRKGITTKTEEYIDPDALLAEVIDVDEAFKTREVETFGYLPGPVLDRPIREVDVQDSKRKR